MKKSRLFILTITLLSVCLTLFFTLRSEATDIPFLARVTIEGNFTGAQAAHAADFDGDGDLDVVGAAANLNQITWWENADGSGMSWNTTVISSTFMGAIDAVPTDVDGDGDMDIVGAALTADHLIWWENENGDGSTWSGHAVDLAFDGIYDIHTADLDGDGDMDIFGAASVANDIAWWENIAGDGSSWMKHDVTTNHPFASSVFAADIDQDGDLDIVSAAGSADKISWWENRLNTAQSWVEHQVSTAVFDFAHWVDAADVDGDGDVDILGAAINDNSIAWWSNDDGTGTAWTFHAIDLTFAGAHTVYAVDADQDGDVDVFGAALNSATIAWWENVNGDGVTWVEHTVDAAFAGAHAVETADLDSDGDLDVLGAARDAADIAWWPNDTIHSEAVYGVDTAVTVDDSFLNAFGVHANDVDGDGDNDILGVAAGGSQVAWWENVDGNGTFGARQLIDPSLTVARSLATADVDRDGDVDVLAAAVGANTIAWFENTGTGWTRHNIDTAFAAAFWVDAADVDGDGDSDVLGASSFNSHTLAWWDNLNGDGSAWATNILTNTFTAAVGVHGTDVDGDGDTDIVGASFGAFPTGAGGRMTWWENVNGDGSLWQAQDIDPAYLGAVGVYSADIDGDGDTDILGAANVDQEFTWWENVNGDGSLWQRDAVGTGFGNAESVYAADLDGDGDNDIIGGSQNDNTVAWWENVAGDGSAWTEHIVDDNYLEAVHVFVADVTGDGWLDILAAGAVENDITYWPNVGGQFNLSTEATAGDMIVAGEQNDLLRVTVGHNGRSGDNAVELSSFALMLEENPGDPLTTAEANGLIDSVAVYLDDGSGVFEAANDTQVAITDTLTLVNGQFSLTFADGDANVQVAHGTTRDYFVVTALTAVATNQSPNSFYLTHLTAPNNSLISTAEDADFDIPLRLVYTQDVSAMATAVAGLTLTQSATPTTALPGQPITYTINVHSDITSTQTIITDVVSANAPLTNITYTSDLPLTPLAGDTFVWDADTLLPDTVGDIMVTGQVETNLTADTVITNSVVGNGRYDGMTLTSTDVATTAVALPHVQFAVADLVVMEDVGTAVITLTMTPANPYAAAQVQVMTVDGTAVADEDYVMIDEVVDVEAGTAVFTITLFLVDDAQAESSETLQLAITSATDALLGEMATATVEIVDNDAGEFGIYLPFIIR